MLYHAVVIWPNTTIYFEVSAKLLIRQKTWCKREDSILCQLCLCFWAILHQLLLHWGSRAGAGCYDLSALQGYDWSINTWTAGAGYNSTFSHKAEDNSPVHTWAHTYKHIPPPTTNLNGTAAASLERKKYFKQLHYKLIQLLRIREWIKLNGLQI